MVTQLTRAPRRPDPPPEIPPLESGDRLTRAEFERRYNAMKESTKAELLDGVVYLASPVRAEHHGRPHALLVTWLGYYEALTPGVEVLGDATVRLDLNSEPQPDALLRILLARGGQSRTSDDDYVEGPPELAAEVAASSVSYDLHPKLEAYRRNGILEYVVWRVLDEAIDWFHLREGKYERLTAGRSRLLKSQVFPGLWLDAAALLRGKLARVLRVLDEGTSSPEHAAFTARLKRARRR